MSTSCGGGYCDCGDSEAWSDFVHCTAHSVGGAGGVAGSPNTDPVSVTFCRLKNEVTLIALQVSISTTFYARVFGTKDLFRQNVTREKQFRTKNARVKC